NARHKVSVSDQPYAGSGFPDFGYFLDVPGTIENNDHKFFNTSSERFCNNLKVVPDRGVQIDPFTRMIIFITDNVRTYNYLVHINIRTMEDTSPLSHSHHRNRARTSVCSKVCALKRVDCDVNLKISFSCPDLFPDIKHRSFVPFSF